LFWSVVLPGLWQTFNLVLLSLFADGDQVG